MTDNNGDEETRKRITARLHPVGKHGLYNVLFSGKLIVKRSREPELDAARWLQAHGHLHGKLTMLDGKTGKPRTIIDIERAAKLTVKEGPLRFGKVAESRPDRGYSHEGEQEVA